VSVLKFGLVGCGAIHTTHGGALKAIPGAELTAVYDVVPGKTQDAAGKLECLPAKSLKDLFAKVDAVCLCVPSGLHAKIGIQAAQAGVHVVCEKPIDVSYKAALGLVEACEEEGVTLTVISQHRFAEDIQKVKNAVDAGVLGRMVMGDGATKWFRSQAYYDSGDWRGTWKLDGGGCLMNQGVHYVDMLQWIMGGVASVQAQIRTLTHDIEVEDVASALVVYKNGAIGTIRGATSVFPGLAETLEIHGEYGTAIIEGDRLKVWDIDPEALVDGSPYGRGVNSQPTPNLHVQDAGKKQGTGASDPTAIWGEQHKLQLVDFVSAVKEKRTPFITGRDALEPLKIILAIYESARKGGKVVAIPE
jgi:predicted dehydrogenase